MRMLLVLQTREEPGLAESVDLNQFRPAAEASFVRSMSSGAMGDPPYARTSRLLKSYFLTSGN